MRSAMPEAGHIANSGMNNWFVKSKFGFFRHDGLPEHEVQLQIGHLCPTPRKGLIDAFRGQGVRKFHFLHS
jgi:hypothetical protein